MLSERLEQAQRHVRDGRLHVQRQRAVIRRLERGGYDSREARWLLSTIEKLLRMHIRERDWLARELAWLQSDA
jgi:hypothetical protein